MIAACVNLDYQSPQKPHYFIACSYKFDLLLIFFKFLSVKSTIFIPY